MRGRTWTALALVAATVAAAGTGSAAAAPTGNYYGVCGKLSANGKTLTVRTVNVRCPLARTLLAKVARLPSPGANKHYPGTYTGLNCAFLKRGGSSIFCTSLVPFRQVVGILG
jgi:hypothetical protein